MATITGARTLPIFCVAFLVSAISGCATIIHGPTQDVTILSNPPGANVTIDGQTAGKTPLRVTMKRREEPYTLTFAKDGYITDNYRTRTGQVTARLVNFLLYPFFGLGVLTYGVDYSTGAQYEITPDPIEYKLRHEPPSELVAAQSPVPVMFSPFVPKGGASTEKAQRASNIYEAMLVKSGRFIATTEQESVRYRFKTRLTWSEPRYTLSIELVDANTGRTIYWDSLQCSTDHVPDAAEKLASRTLRDLTAKPSAVSATTSGTQLLAHQETYEMN